MKRRRRSRLGRSTTGELFVSIHCTMGPYISVWRALRPVRAGTESHVLRSTEAKATSTPPSKTFPIRWGFVSPQSIPIRGASARVPSTSALGGLVPSHPIGARFGVQIDRPPTWYGAMMMPWARAACAIANLNLCERKLGSEQCTPAVL